MKKILVSGLLLAVGLTACSSAKKAGDSAAASSPTASSGVSASVSAGGSLGADDGSAWCALAKSYDKQSGDVQNAFKGIDFRNPEKAKKQLADAYRGLRPKFKQLFVDAAKVAPVEIRADFVTLGDGMNKFMDALDAAGYDFTKLSDPKVSQTLSDPKFRAAGERIGIYDKEHCGIPYTPQPAAS